MVRPLFRNVCLRSGIGNLTLFWLLRMASFPASGDDCDDEDLHAYLIIFHKYIRGFSISCHKIMAALDDIMGVRLEKKYKILPSTTYNPLEIQIKKKSIDH